MTRRALITGITGQDGVYLATLLLEQGYQVHGMVRHIEPARLRRIAHLQGRVQLHEGDLVDPAAIVRIVQRVHPHELYNLAAQSFIPASTLRPLETAETTALGVARVLEAVRLVDPGIRFYQASSSEMFGCVAEHPQRETTPFCPRNHYGIAKLYGHWLTAHYRSRYGLFACSGILYNHESPLRDRQYVTRKVTDAVARIKLGRATQLTLGDLDARRDWGFAGDYVRAMWLMLQQDHPDDYVVASGTQHSVRELAARAFGHAGLDWREHVRVDPALVRPADVTTLCGDASKARRVLGWEPTIGFDGLIDLMVEADLELVRGEPRRH